MKFNEKYCAELSCKSRDKQLKRDIKKVPKITNMFYKYVLKEIKKSAKNGDTLLTINNHVAYVDYDAILDKLRKLKFDVYEGYLGYHIEWGNNKNE